LVEDGKNKDGITQLDEGSMSLLWLESFRGLSASTLVNKYSVIGQPGVNMDIISPPGRRARAALSITDDSQNIIKHVDNKQTLIIGFAIYWPSSGGSGIPTFNQLLILNSQAGVDQVNLYYATGPVLQVRRGGTILATGTTVLQEDTWYYIELKVTIDNSPNGSYELRINGATEVSDPAVDTQDDASNNTIQEVNIGSFGFNNTTVLITDWYIFDDAGSTNNDFIASNSYDVHVEPKFPNADGTTNDWTPQGGGENYVEVDEAGGIDGDTTYNSADTVGNIDLYELPDLVNPPDSILGIQINLDARKEPGPARTIEDVVRSGGSNFLGSGSIASMSVNSDYEPYHTIHETDPDTAAAWTESGFNAAEFGARVES
jgi:hypothetical protein